MGPVKDSDISILGLTYKPNTDVIEESAPVKIAQALRQKGARLAVYDPAGMESARKVLGNKGMRYAISAVECLKNTEFCLLATPWEEFKKLTPDDFARNMRRPRLLDCWRLYNRPEFKDKEKLEYFAIGLAREK